MRRILRTLLHLSSMDSGILKTVKKDSAAKQLYERYYHKNVLNISQIVCFSGLESLQVLLPFYYSGSGTFYDLRHFTILKTAAKVIVSFNFFQLLRLSHEYAGCQVGLQSCQSTSTKIQDWEKYRRYQLFSSANIGGFKDNFS